MKSLRTKKSQKIAKPPLIQTREAEGMAILRETLIRVLGKEEAERRLALLEKNK